LNAALPSSSRSGERLLEDALRHSEDSAPAVRADALETAGWVAIGRDDMDCTREHLEHALALYRELGDDRSAARCRLHLATAASNTHEFDRADQLLDDAAKAVQLLSDTRIEAWLAFTRGLVALERRDLQPARRRFREGLRLYERTDFARGVTLSLANLGEVAFAEGDVSEAQSLLQEALARFSADADHSGTVAMMVVAAASAGREGRHHDAAALLGAAESFSEATGARIVRSHGDHVATLVASAEEAIGPPAFRQAHRRGRRMRIDDAVVLALGRRVVGAA